MISTRRSRLPWARPETLAFDASPEPELGVKCLRNQDFEVAVRRIGVRARSNRNGRALGELRVGQGVAARMHVEHCDLGGGDGELSHGVNLEITSSPLAHRPVRISMSVSPNTVNRLPLPVFFSSPPITPDRC